MTHSHKLRVFLCHASQDKAIVRELYQRLSAEDWIDPWLDEEKLLPGQDWDLEIEKAVEDSDAVIVCLSNQSVSKEGYVQKELRKVLDIALEKPEETIFVIPLRLDECDLPRRLRTWHFVDYFPAERRDRSYRKLLDSLRVRSGGTPAKKQDIPPAQPPTNSNPPSPKVVDSSLADTKASTNAGMGWAIPVLFFFLLVGMDVFLPSSDAVENLMGACALLAGIIVAIRRQFPGALLIKVSLTVFLLFYGLDYTIEEILPSARYLVGIAALVTGGLWVAALKRSRKPVLYAPIAFAIFLFLVGTFEILTNIAYSDFTTLLDTLIMVASLIASALVWVDA